MNAIRTIGFLFASLAMFSIAEAQKGKPGGGGGTPPPYTPVIVNVTCDGTGTKLQDALNALNPVANVYEVRISGVCPENLLIGSFSSLSIQSANVSSPATIGTLRINAREASANIRLNDVLIVQNDPTVSAIIVGMGSSFFGKNISLSCVEIGQCSSILQAFSSTVTISGISATGFVDNGRMLFDRGANAFVLIYGDDAYSPCSPIGKMIFRLGSTGYVAAGDAPCELQDIAVEWGGNVTYLGQNRIGIDASKGGLVSGGSDSTNSWYSNLSCGPGAVVVNWNSPTENYCP